MSETPPEFVPTPDPLIGASAPSEPVPVDPSPVEVDETPNDATPPVVAELPIDAVPLGVSTTAKVYIVWDTKGASVLAGPFPTKDGADDALLGAQAAASRSANYNEADHLYTVEEVTGR